MVDHSCVSERSKAITKVARTWLGTPYQHQASCKGVGTDCLGLVRGIWREVLGPEPEETGAYSPSWAETSSDEAMLNGLLRHCEALSILDARPGDILIFRMLQRGPAKHAGVLNSGSVGDPSARMIHAYSGHAVCETRLTQAWCRRMVAICRFPKALGPSN